MSILCESSVLYVLALDTVGIHTQYRMPIDIFDTSVTRILVFVGITQKLGLQAILIHNHMHKASH